MARALAAAIAVLLLAVSGAGGAGVQTPRRGGTVTCCRRRSEPACLNPVIEFMRRERREHPRLCALRRVRVGPDLSWRPKLVSRVELHAKPPFTLTYHIRPEARGATAFRSPRATSSSRTRRSRATRPPATMPASSDLVVRSVRAVDAKTVSVVLRARFAGFRDLFPVVLPAHALRGEDLRDVWSGPDRQSEDRGPIGSGPFLVGPWDRGEQMTSVRNQNYWGPHRAYLDRLVIRYDANAAALTGAEAADLFRTGEVDVIQRRSSPRISPPR